LTLLQQFPTTLLLYGSPFFVRELFGWDLSKTGLSQVMIGFAVAVSSYVGGQIAHRKSSRYAILCGLTLSVSSCLLGGLWGYYEPVYWLVLFGFAFGQSLVWPGLEALLVEGEPPARVAHIVAYYNIIWSLGTACSFLVATPAMAYFGLPVVFWGPFSFYLLNIPFVLKYIPKRVEHTPETTAEHIEAEALVAEATRFLLAERTAFRQLGWLANPLGFVAINVLITFNPVIQARLGLRFEQASIWFSLWFYVRSLSFEVLRRWLWWHYRWGFLCFMVFVMMASFVCITMAQSIAMLLLGQVGFGFTLGLLYQSSLFYAMAESDSAGEHGGWHECFIGLGSMTGNIVLFASSRFAPKASYLPIYAVGGLMCVGFSLLLVIGMRLRKLHNQGERGA
jgi:MFS family permease